MQKKILPRATYEQIKDQIVGSRSNGDPFPYPDEPPMFTPKVFALVAVLSLPMLLLSLAAWGTDYSLSPVP